MSTTLQSETLRTVPFAGTAVRPLAFGAARLTAGDGWGEPEDRAASIRLALHAAEAGVTLFDTADALGPGVSESILGDAFAGRDDVVIATKVGMLRPAANRWDVLGHPNYLRQQIRLSLARLRRERLDFVYLHRIDPNYPLADQIGALQEAREAGLIGAIGISEPTLEQFNEVLRLEPNLGAVQSLYNLAARGNQTIAERARTLGIAFAAYWPLIGRGYAAQQRRALFAALDEIAEPLGLTAAQLSLAWIFTTQPQSIAIAGTRSIDHLRSNLRASEVGLDAETLAAIERSVSRVIGDTEFDPRQPVEASA